MIIKFHLTVSVIIKTCGITSIGTAEPLAFGRNCKISLITVSSVLLQCSQSHPRTDRVSLIVTTVSVAYQFYSETTTLIVRLSLKKSEIVRLFTKGYHFERRALRNTRY